MKFNVVDAIVTGIFPGMIHQRLITFYPYDPSGKFCHRQGKIAQTAKQIQHGIVFIKI